VQRSKRLKQQTYHVWPFEKVQEKMLLLFVYRLNPLKVESRNPCGRIKAEAAFQRFWRMHFSIRHGQVFASLHPIQARVSAIFVLTTGQHEDSESPLHQKK
jgi:hypothetical protein